MFLPSKWNKDCEYAWRLDVEADVDDYSIESEHNEDESDLESDMESGSESEIESDDKSMGDSSGDEL